MDRARGCAGCDTEVSALPSGLCGAIHGLRHIVGGSQLRLVVCCDQLCCGFALFGGDGYAWALQETITSPASKRAAGFMPVVSDRGNQPRGSRFLEAAARSLVVAFFVYPRR